MKKISFLVALVLIISMLAVPVSAAQSAHISVSASSSTVHRGDTFTITLSASTVENCTGGSFMFRYDKNVFQYVSGSAFPGNFYAGVDTQAGNLTCFFMNGNATVQGAFCQVTFRVLDNAAFGSFTISGAPRMTVNDEQITTTSGSVTITVACKHSWGDWTGTQPTCGAAGSLTRTCSTCNATVSDTPAATGNHNYGGWSKVDDNTHKHTCIVCNTPETSAHSWDNGTITKDPTCKETGTMTYKCSTCNGTKAETLGKTENHAYGSWTKVNDTTHKHICSTCSKEETANHKWDNGVITKQATCKETGVMTYSCSDCPATKTDDIPKTTTHTYGAWTKVDETTHKHTCTVCSVSESANHKWDDGKITKDPTCKAEGVMTYTCSDCNGTKTEAVPKTTTHTYGAWTKVDETTHKHTCTVCNVSESANHKWDDGKITKDPTCKDTGVKTYTCSDCNATKTQDVPKTTTHKYGSWTKINDDQHKHICQVCDKEETENHTWNSGVITTKPTCKDEGEKTYTCTGCNTTKTEVIEKLTTHTYDHDCDTDCNVCGVTRETTHQYKTTWSKDKNEHWHECSVCKDKKDAASHTPGAAATEYNPQTCTTCGYVIKAALGHKHKYATTWTTDEKGHWYVCSGCEEKGSYADHDFENACDTDCSVCEYTREIEHAFEEKWVTDENGHWHVCSVCELKQDEADHEPGAKATATTAQTCTICDYEIAPALGVPETTEAPTEAPTTEPETPAVDDNGDDQNQIVVIAVVAAVVVALVGMIVVLIAKKKKNS